MKVNAGPPLGYVGGHFKRGGIQCQEVSNRLFGWLL